MNIDEKIIEQIKEMKHKAIGKSYKWNVENDIKEYKTSIRKWEIEYGLDESVEFSDYNFVQEEEYLLIFNPTIIIVFDLFTEQVVLYTDQIKRDYHISYVKEKQNMIAVDEKYNIIFPDFDAIVYKFIFDNPQSTFSFDTNKGYNFTNLSICKNIF